MSLILNIYKVNNVNRYVVFNAKFVISRFYSVRLQLDKNNIKDLSPSSLPNAYRHEEFEKGWYEWWEGNGYFKPNNNKETFSLLLPPPNVTGALHLGHAYTGTIQDVIARWKRMQGYSVCWIPGVDHAGIATQAIVEKKLMKERSLTKHEIGKSEFVKQVWLWKNEKGDTILKQLRGLGLSLDWSKHVFTMDAAPCEAVKSAFILLFDAGLIYRDNAFVNWSCALQSSISDVEVEVKEIQGPTQMHLPRCKEVVEFGNLYEIAYRLHNEDDELVIATTRPETLLGDTAVALHPDDSRRSNLEGKSVWHPFLCQPIPIVFDSFVDPNFGTGAVKITPAHDPNDWEVAKRHKLSFVTVFDDSGTVVFSEFKGLQRYAARAKILDRLSTLGLLRGKRNHSMQLPLCSRSGDVVEQFLRPQWFVNCKYAAYGAIEAVKSGNLKIHPQNYEKLWFHWLENIKDWNISRQLWWGHPIPAFKVSIGSKETWVAASSVDEAREKATTSLGVPVNSIVDVTQDEDVLDTWFSSGLFPLYALGWPQCGEEFFRRYPFSLLDTAPDILFFWVARMVMMSSMLTGRLPFDNVLLHGIICDVHGRKMSKSIGNVISPEDVIDGASLEALTQKIEESHKRGLLTSQELKTSLEGQKKLFPNGIPACGVDALRFTLCSQTISNNFVSFDVTTCHTNSLFCNKVLQAFKFMLLSLENQKTSPTFELKKELMNGFDLWILSRLSATVSEINTALGAYHLHTATSLMKHFFYYELCDVYLEASKPVLRSEDERLRLTTLTTLFRCIETGLRLLHPVMPFISEELYQRLPAIDGFTRHESVMIAPYPEPTAWEMWANPELDVTMQHVNDVISGCRKIKALFGTKGEKPEVIVSTTNANLYKFMDSHSAVIKTLARASTVKLTEGHDIGVENKFFKEPISYETVVFGSFNNEKAVLMKRLEPTLKKEEKLKIQVNKVQELISNSPFSNSSRTSLSKHLEKLKSLQRELEKIEEIKRMLQ